MGLSFGARPPPAQLALETRALAQSWLLRSFHKLAVQEQGR